MMVEWNEQDTRDAQRLCRVLMERTEKRRRLAGGLEGPAEIHKSSASPLEKGADGEKSGLGSGALDPRRQQSTVANGEVFRGNGLGVDGVECVGSTEPDEVTMRPSTSSADSNRHMFTTGLEGNRAVRWGNGE
ncbi:hypothetical protein FJ973_29755 [Mesorhizobium sp. B2-1-3]|uniref:hypothetical protein n=1 Tax=Mesorhizobium sp. B2-1-3 TaxID=2589972 RepID=UPI00112BEB6B|nr:hypothetical protein [Mesorhizobium sp. B2-1-3]TPN03830.1 hypothetical protein FJ973_29755 [Mesorhizobium sp. B2-1-3]